MDSNFNMSSNQRFKDTKSQYSISTLQSMQKDIRQCIGILSTHCVYFSSRWASELLISINKQIQLQQQKQSSFSGDEDDDDQDGNTNEQKSKPTNTNKLLS
eukprot:CAMPEP_0201587048 /NCGR_PEP_ID=MMETSP0190_2-20130828/139138_1 /ASSEMBLY_ACC=CAM_ASM_000263 /TAXON_ID=37353 /ORGANISM="Rosalina sp." /LENGTH=100 /DNA_ID=CAMNT_0048036213 /DNA_START=19 /DNA_END=317 /DNA_ORIENTATION=+